MPKMELEISIKCLQSCTLWKILALALKQLLLCRVNLLHFQFAWPFFKFYYFLAGSLYLQDNIWKQTTGNHLPPTKAITRKFLGLAPSLIQFHPMRYSKLQKRVFSSQEIHHFYPSAGGCTAHLIWQSQLKILSIQPLLDFLSHPDLAVLP